MAANMALTLHRGRGAATTVAVSDFGFARLAMDAKTHVTTRVVGTFGYLAPEYASRGKLTDRSDVYSFGVVLLELITGRQPVDNSQPMCEESLVEWARPRLIDALGTREFGQIPDPWLGNDYNGNEMFRLIEAAVACIRHSATMRPSMGKVVQVLNALADVDLNNGVKPGQSKIFNALEYGDIRLFQRIAFGTQVFSPEHSQSSWSNQSELSKSIQGKEKRNLPIIWCDLWEGEQNLVTASDDAAAAAGAGDADVACGRCHSGGFWIVRTRQLLRSR
ncbi:hypothetical protein ZIOFF_015088 [Zingiber officinale]|uniref:non-specific serine/threonine protein kinase n=1 Tax=Zingiber officinale TaxID=94328 RepID=A0A8J5LW19_ZINOF|nr:hypothetical protein ZIOFF_015088 [Zingiber officinale]